MKISVVYCGYIRKNGSLNRVSFDTESKRFTTKDEYNNSIFVEAKVSKDVDTLRDTLIQYGYTEY